MEQDISGLLKFISTTEEILFSFPLPQEVVQKYEGLKKQVFSASNLDCNTSRIWKMYDEQVTKNQFSMLNVGVQVGAENQLLESYKFQELQESANILRFEYLGRLDSSHNLLIQYQQFLRYINTSINNLLTKFSEILETMDFFNEQEVQILKSNHIIISEQVHDMYDLEKLAQNELQQYKRNEKLAQDILRDVEGRFKQKEKKFLRIFEQLIQHIYQQDDQIDSLKSEFKEFSVRSTNEQQEYKEKINQYKIKMQSEKEQLENQHKKQQEQSQKMNEILIQDQQKNFQNEISKILKEKEELVDSFTKFKQDQSFSKDNWLSEREDLKYKYENSIQSIKRSHIQELEELKRSHHQKLQQIQNEYSQQIDQLQYEINDQQQKSLQNESFIKQQLESTETQLKRQLDTVENQYQKLLPEYNQLQEKLKELKPKTNEMQEIVSNLKQVLDPISQNLLNKNLGETTEELVQVVQLLNESYEQAITDNRWLVEQLSEFGKENERLRLVYNRPIMSQSQQELKPTNFVDFQVIQDIRGTSNALKEYKVSRCNLLRQLVNNHP